MDHITLLGAEDVQRAGRTIAVAAETIGNAALSMSNTADRMQQFMDQYAARVEAAMQPPPAVAPSEDSERKAWEAWAVADGQAYRAPGRGLVFYDVGAAAPSWTAWLARSKRG